MVLTCNHTGYIGVIPVKTKGQLTYVTHEVMAFVQLLGWKEVAVYGDNAPNHSTDPQDSGHCQACIGPQDQDLYHKDQRLSRRQLGREHDPASETASVYFGSRCEPENAAQL